MTSFQNGIKDSGEMLCQDMATIHEVLRINLIRTTVFLEGEGLNDISNFIG